MFLFITVKKPIKYNLKAQLLKSKLNTLILIAVCLSF